jgi:hypothetical protein
MADTAGDSRTAPSPPPPQLDPRMSWTCLFAAIGIAVFHCLMIVFFKQAYTLELVPLAVTFLGAGGLIRMDVVSQVVSLLKIIR